MDQIIHINGWPGCGKLTIARLLAKRLDGKLLDNHTLLNPAEALFDRADPLHASLRREVRASVLGHAARLKPGTLLVLTDALSNDPTDQAFFDDYRTLAAKRGARLISVVLDCDHDENVRRLNSPGRSELHKLTRPDFLDHLRANYQLLRPQGVDLVEIDVSALSADEAAAAIEQALPASPATGH
jgi:thymidylate kinase